MNNKRKIFLLLSLLCLFTCLYFVKTTYAKYRTNASGELSATIARWNIKVNNTTIKNNDVLQNSINPVFETSTHIADDVIAPTSKGYFDLTIDATDVDVSFTYTISIEQKDEYSLLKDFIVTGYSTDGGTTINTLTTAEVSNDILYTDTTRVQSLRIYIEWIDHTTGEQMSDADDTQITNEYENVALDVVMSFTQKAA